MGCCRLIMAARNQPQAKEVCHDEPVVTPCGRKSADSPKRRIKLGFVCNTWIKTNPGAELRRKERFPCMFENIPVSSISAENTVVLHRSSLTVETVWHVAYSQPLRHIRFNNHPVRQKNGKKHPMDWAFYRVRKTETPMRDWHCSKFLALNCTDLHMVESGHPICRNLRSLLFASSACRTRARRIRRSC